MAELYGLELIEPPEGWAVLSIVALVNAVDADGREAMFMRTSAGISGVASLGMLTIATRLVSDDVAGEFYNDGDSPNPEE